MLFMVIRGRVKVARFSPCIFFVRIRYYAPLDVGRNFFTLDNHREGSPPNDSPPTNAWKKMTPEELSESRWELLYRAEYSTRYHRRRSAFFRKQIGRASCRERVCQYV